MSSQIRCRKNRGSRCCFAAASAAAAAVTAISSFAVRSAVAQVVYQTGTMGAANQLSGATLDYNNELGRIDYNMSNNNRLFADVRRNGL